MSEEGKKQLGKIALQQRAVPVNQPAREVDPLSALKALSERFGVPALDLAQLCLNLEDLAHLPREIAEQHRILPVLTKDDRVFVAMANPQDKRVIDELEFVSGKKVFPYVADEEALREVIERAYLLKSRGERFYVGPRCPPEVAQRATGGSESEFSERLSLSGRPPGEEASVVVDDTIDRVTRADPPVEDEAFDDLSEELSGVTDLPTTEQPTRPGAKTVLVVDDESEIRVMLKRLLEANGFNVVEANSGAVALRMVKEHTPDLMVLDAMLPEIHGFDIARRIKQSKRYASMPIIMVSAVHRGWRYAEDMRESFGVEYYIEKPFKIGDIVKAVTESLAADKPADSEQHSAAAEQHLKAGVDAYKRGEVEAAIDHLLKGIEVDPLAYRLRFHLGLLYSKQGKVYEAIAALENAVEINSRHFPGLKNLAILYQKAGLRHKAAEMWERALNQAEDDATRQAIKDHLLALL